MSIRSLKNKTKLKRTSVMTLMSFFKRNLTDFFTFYVDTLFINEHAQLKKLFKLKTTSENTLLNDLFEKKSY